MPRDHASSGAPPMRFFGKVHVCTGTGLQLEVNPTPIILQFERIAPNILFYADSSASPEPPFHMVPPGIHRVSME